MLYQKYFENIVSRTWLGQKGSLQDNNIEKSEIEEIYYEHTETDKIVLIGKSKSFYFMLECFNSDNFYYSNGLFNTELENLIEGYKQKNKLLCGMTVKGFINGIILQSSLEKNLSKKDVEIVKRLKI